MAGLNTLYVHNEYVKAGIDGFISWTNSIYALLNPPKKGEVTKPDTGQISSPAIPALLVALVPVINHFKNLMDSVSKFLKDPSKAASEGLIHRVRQRLGGLLQQATSGGRRFVIIIDDLERCKAENALAILDLVNQLLSHPNVVVIISGDMEAIAASAGTKYKEQAKLLTSSKEERTSSLEYGRRYLQKVVQMQFDLPPPVPATMETLTKPQEKRSVEPMTTAAFQVMKSLLQLVGFISQPLSFLIKQVSRISARKLIDPVHLKQEATIVAESLSNLGLIDEYTKQRFEEAGIRDEAIMQSAIQEVKERYEATAKATKFLIEHCSMTPRQIKRYENSLRVHYRILSDREVPITGELPERLAKWLALQDRWPTVADRFYDTPDLLTQVETLLPQYGQTLIEQNFPSASFPDELAKLLLTEPKLGKDLFVLQNLRPFTLPDLTQPEMVNLTLPPDLSTHKML